MFWDNPNDSNTKQRLKNQIFLRLPLTNAERDRALPALMLGGLVMLALFIGVAIGHAIFR